MAQVKIHENGDAPDARPFRHEADYLTLSRMLLRYQNLILLTPVPDDRIAVQLAPWQKKIQDELWSASPLHRTKWLRNVEYARTLLLRLEKSAQAIKVQRAKRDAVTDLAEKRAIIKRLRTRIEEIGREIETRPDAVYHSNAPDQQRETLYDVLVQIDAKRQKESASRDTDDENPNEELQPEQKSEPLDSREALLGSNLRRRQGKLAEPKNDSKALITGHSPLRPHEKASGLTADENEKLAVDMLDLVIQLKQNARRFESKLTEGKETLDQVGQALQLSETAMEAARKGMNSLTRMSEEEGFFGRLKLYAIILGLWMVSIMFVFAGPKLRF